MAKDDTYENIVWYWEIYKDSWNYARERQLKVPIMSPVSVSPHDMSLPVEYVPANVLTYAYIEENFYNCVVGMVECEGVIVWRDVVAQWS